MIIVTEVGVSCVALNSSSRRFLATDEYLLRLFAGYPMSTIFDNISHGSDSVRPMRPFALSVLVLVCTATLWGQTDFKTGPAVGSRVPDFEAADQDGARQSLQSIMGPKGAILVFFRSADW